MNLIVHLLRTAILFGVCSLPSRHDGGAVIVKNGGVLVSAKIAFSGNELRIALNQAIKMKAGDKLVVEFQ